MDASDLLALYVERHNESVHSGENTTAELFHEDAVRDVEGGALSALRRFAIMEAFCSHELMLWEIGTVSEDEAFANYAWRGNPRLGGTLRVKRRGELIASLLVKPGYARTFATLSMPPPPGSGLGDDGPNVFGKE